MPTRGSQRAGLSELTAIRTKSLVDDPTGYLTTQSPGEDALARLPLTELRKASTALLENWSGLLDLSGRPPADHQHESAWNDGVVVVEGDLLVNVLVLHTAIWERDVWRALRQRKQSVSDAASLATGQMADRIVHAPLPATATVWDQRLLRYCAAYLVTRFTAWAAQGYRLRPEMPPAAAAVFEQFSHQGLVDLFDGYVNLIESEPRPDPFSDDWRRTVARFICRTALSELATCYRLVSSSEMALFHETPHHFPTSLLRPDELPLLASRHPTLIQRYGERQVDRTFEAQLALAMQALGFVVAATRSGERRVDLVCLSSSEVERATVLVEAKSSKKPYALPASDERALVEYVREVRRQLTTLPAMRLVLIVSGSASGTLSERLRHLEPDLGVALRFCPAAELASLIRIPGAVRGDAFMGHLLRATHVVPSGFAMNVLAAERQRQQAHVDLVRALLTPGRVTHTDPTPALPRRMAPDSAAG